MDSELVSGSESSNGEGGGTSRPSSLSTYGEQFERLCPLYMALGMTYEQYWDGDAELVRAYRKAHELRQEMQNQTLWLQGMYIYEALCCVAPILRPFSKSKKPIPYRSQPYPLNTTFSKEKEAKRKRDSDNKAKAKMESFMVQFNRKFEKKGG